VVRHLPVVNDALLHTRRQLNEVPVQIFRFQGFVSRYPKPPFFQSIFCSLHFNLALDPFALSPYPSWHSFDCKLHHSLLSCRHIQQFLLPFSNDINLTVLCEFDGFHVLAVGLSLWVSLRLWNVVVDIVEVVECGCGRQLRTSFNPLLG
jgi:hypothetical protein